MKNWKHFTAPNPRPLFVQRIGNILMTQYGNAHLIPGAQSPDAAVRLHRRAVAVQVGAVGVEPRLGALAVALR